MVELIKKRITLCTAFMVITSCPVAHGSSNFLPSPFPICSVDEKVSRFQSQIDAGYSVVTTDSMELGCSGIVTRGMFMNNEVGWPSFHFVLNGSMVQGKQELKSNYYDYNGERITHENDVDGYLVGAAFTPSVIITDHFSSLKPIFFLGTNIQLQSLDIMMADAFYYMMNSNDWTKPVYNPFQDLRSENKMVLSGFHTGLQIGFRCGTTSISPFIMTQIVRGKSKWEDSNGLQNKATFNYAVHTVGTELRFDHPTISITATAQFVEEEDKEDAKAYTLTTGLAF